MTHAELSGKIKKYLKTNNYPAYITVKVKKNGTVIIDNLPYLSAASSIIQAAAGLNAEYQSQSMAKVTLS